MITLIRPLFHWEFRREDGGLVVGLRISGRFLGIRVAVQEVALPPRPWLTDIADVPYATAPVTAEGVEFVELVQSQHAATFLANQLAGDEDALKATKLEFANAQRIAGEIIAERAWNSAKQDQNPFGTSEDGFDIGGEG